MPLCAGIVLKQLVYCTAYWLSVGTCRRQAGCLLFVIEGEAGVDLLAAA